MMTFSSFSEMLRSESEFSRKKCSVTSLCLLPPSTVWDTKKVTSWVKIPVRWAWLPMNFTKLNSNRDGHSQNP